MSKRPRIAIKATNLAASLAFYIDTLGFELIEALPEVDMAVIRDNDPDSFWGRILLAGPQVSDIKAHLDEPHVVLKPGDILDFPEKDMNARHASLAGKGLGDQIHEEEDSWGDRKLILQDPDGYRIIFLRPAQPSPETMATLYAQGGDELASIILDGLSESELDLVRSPDEWSIRQIVHHLAETDTLFLLAIETALAQSGSTYVRNPYDQDLWVKALNYTGRPIEPSLALVRAIRAHITHLLQHVPDYNEHYVMMKWADQQGEGRKVTVSEFVDSLVRHHAEHCEEIRETLRVSNRQFQE